MLSNNFSVMHFRRHITSCLPNSVLLVLFRAESAHLHTISRRLSLHPLAAPFMLHVCLYAYATPRRHACPRGACTREQRRNADFSLRVEFKSAAVTPDQYRISVRRFTLISLHHCRRQEAVRGDN